MSKVEALAPGPAPQTASWRAQLPTLIRVYGIVLTLLLLLTVVTIGNPAFISQQANLDPGIIFDVLTIVVVGGTSLSGGSGAMWRTAVGLGIIATISNGFGKLPIFTRLPSGF